MKNNRHIPSNTHWIDSDTYAVDCPDGTWHVRQNGDYWYPHNPHGVRGEAEWNRFDAIHTVLGEAGIACTREGCR